jgi:hypothetical protein
MVQVMRFTPDKRNPTPNYMCQLGIDFGNNHKKTPVYFTVGMRASYMHLRGVTVSPDTFSYLSLGPTLGLHCVQPISRRVDFNFALCTTLNYANSLVVPTELYYVLPLISSTSEMSLGARFFHRVTASVTVMYYTSIWDEIHNWDSSQLGVGLELKYFIPED